MSMVTESKAVLGFNLSFFSEEHEVIEQYFSQLVQWVEEGKLQAPSLVVYDMAGHQPQSSVVCVICVIRSVAKVSCVADSETFIFYLPLRRFTFPTASRETL